MDPPSLTETRSWIGDGVETLVRRGLVSRLDAQPTPAQLGAALAAFQRCYRENLFVRTRCYAGAQDTLAELARANLKLGCVTNKPETFARELLAQAGLGRFFDFVHGGDTYTEKKPHPMPLREGARRFGIDPGRSVMVGDSINDLVAARSAGFGFVFARYGYTSPPLDELESGLGTIDNLPELIRLLSR